MENLEGGDISEVSGGESSVDTAPPPEAQEQDTSELQSPEGETAPVEAEDTEDPPSMDDPGRADASALEQPPADPATDATNPAMTDPSGIEAANNVNETMDGNTEKTADSNTDKTNGGNELTNTDNKELTNETTDANAETDKNIESDNNTDIEKNAHSGTSKEDLDANELANTDYDNSADFDYTDEEIQQLIDEDPGYINGDVLDYDDPAYLEEGIHKIDWGNDSADTPHNETLEPGTQLSRVGDENGTYLGDADVNYNDRQLPIMEGKQPIHQYEVLKPLDVEQSTIAPQKWGPEMTDVNAQQYKTNVPISKLIDEGYLREIPPTKTH